MGVVVPKLKKLVIGWRHYQMRTSVTPSAHALTEVVTVLVKVDNAHVLGNTYLCAIEAG